MTAGTETTTQLLTAEQVADRWQLEGGAAAVYRMSREGLIKTVRIRRYYRYRVEDLKEFEEAGGKGID